MEELQCVKLRKSFKGLTIGTKGTIVLKYTENDFEVEFFDAEGNTIGVYTITGDYIELRSKEIIKIRLDYLQGPIWISDVETGQPITGVDVVDNDEIIRQLNYEITFFVYHFFPVPH